MFYKKECLISINTFLAAESGYSESVIKRYTKSSSPLIPNIIEFSNSFKVIFKISFLFIFLANVQAPKLRVYFAKGRLTKEIKFN